MVVREQIVELLCEAVDALNSLQPPDKQVPKSLDTKLFGRDGVIDSLALVQLISELESRIEDHFSITVALADERAMSQTRSPFRTLGSFADYAVAIVEEAKRSG